MGRSKEEGEGVKEGGREGGREVLLGRVLLNKNVTIYQALCYM